METVANPRLQRKSGLVLRLFEQYMADCLNERDLWGALGDAADLYGKLGDILQIYVQSKVEPPTSYVWCQQCQDVGYIETDDADMFYTAVCPCRQGGEA